MRVLHSHLRPGDVDQVRVLHTEARAKVAVMILLLLLLLLLRGSIPEWPAPEWLSGSGECPAPELLSRKHPGCFGSVPERSVSCKAT